MDRDRERPIVGVEGRRGSGRDWRRGDGRTLAMGRRGQQDREGLDGNVWRRRQPPGDDGDTCRV